MKDNEKRADDHKLVSNGIEKFSKVGYKSVSTRNLSVKHIGKRCSDKENGTYKAGNVKRYHAVGKHSQNEKYWDKTKS